MRPAIAVLVAAGLASPTIASATEAGTTRIETRPFYGATVTLEHGVRVFRPLPPHDKVIINPGGATPLSLGIAESHNVSHNYYNTNGAPGTFSEPSYAYGAYGIGPALRKPLQRRHDGVRHITPGGVPGRR
mgnify:CR=1 FL=1